MWGLGTIGGREEEAADTRIRDGDEPWTRHRSGSACGADTPASAAAAAAVDADEEPGSLGMHRRAPYDAPQVTGHGRMRRPLGDAAMSGNCRAWRGR